MIQAAAAAPDEGKRDDTLCITSQQNASAQHSQAQLAARAPKKPVLTCDSIVVPQESDEEAEGDDGESSEASDVDLVLEQKVRASNNPFIYSETAMSAKEWATRFHIMVPRTPEISEGL